MGKTKIKKIDDSVAPKKEQVYPERSRGDKLVEKLKQELGIEKEKKVPKVEKVSKVSQSKTKSRSKKYLEASKDLDRSKAYPLPEALDMVKKMSYAKFNATIEAHINTMQTGLRGFISLPYASGKNLSILVFGPSQPKIEGVVFGTDSILDEIEKGKINFDLIITTPEWMSKLAKVARILGPKGLMPNPKNGTVTDDLKKTVESFQAGKTEYKTEAKTPIIHLALGKLNQPNEELEANIKTLLQIIGKTKIKKVTLSPTMGAGVKLDLSSF